MVYLKVVLLRAEDGICPLPAENKIVTMPSFDSKSRQCWSDIENCWSEK